MPGKKPLSQHRERAYNCSRGFLQKKTGSFVRKFSLFQPGRLLPSHSNLNKYRLFSGVEDTQCLTVHYIPSLSPRERDPLGTLLSVPMSPSHQRDVGNPRPVQVQGGGGGGAGRGRQHSPRPEQAPGIYTPPLPKPVCARAGDNSHNWTCPFSLSPVPCMPSG